LWDDSTSSTGVATDAFLSDERRDSVRCFVAKIALKSGDSTREWFGLKAALTAYPGHPPNAIGNNFLCSFRRKGIALE
jgi:hypothetical protein